jgi:hypothetical protein
MLITGIVAAGQQLQRADHPLEKPKPLLTREVLLPYICLNWLSRGILARSPSVLPLCHDLLVLSHFVGVHPYSDHMMISVMI